MTIQRIQALLPDMDLEVVTRAVVRESAIRQAMEETGESREILAEMYESMASMDQEAVLPLTEGEPMDLEVVMRAVARESSIACWMAETEESRAPDSDEE